MEPTFKWKRIESEEDMPDHGRDVLVKYDSGKVDVSRRWSMQRVDDYAIAKLHNEGISLEIFGGFISKPQFGRIVAWREIE